MTKHLRRNARCSNAVRRRDLVGRRRKVIGNEAPANSTQFTPPTRILPNLLKLFRPWPGAKSARSSPAVYRRSQDDRDQEPSRSAILDLCDIRQHRRVGQTSVIVRGSEIREFLAAIRHAERLPVPPVPAHSQEVRAFSS